MEQPNKRQKISRIDIRYRRSFPPVTPAEEPEEEKRGPEVPEEEEAFAAGEVEPLLIRERKGRIVMGNRHQEFHRRQAAASNVLTVLVDVINTVDANGNVVGQETSTVGPASEAAVTAAAVPTVPAVPPFPSTLTVPAVPSVPSVALPSVPAYPFTSSVTSAIPTGATSQVVISSPIPTSGASSGVSSGFPTTIGFNSTISSTISTSLSSSLNSTTSFSSSLSSTSQSSSSSSTLTLSSTSHPSSSATSASSLETGGGGGGGGQVNTAAPPAATTAAAGGREGSNGGSSIDTPKVVGGVFGALAGLALLLVLILFLLRRHKQQKRRAALPSSGTDNGDSQPIASSGQGMAQRSSMVPSFLNRFSGASRSTADTSTTGGERGFQRISGRKLPSAWSAGMTSEQVARGEGTLSESSFYKDDKGFYGGPGVGAGAAAAGAASTSGAMGTKEKMMPSPARTPIIHHPDDAPAFGGGTQRPPSNPFMSPPHSPNPDLPPRGTLGRSHPSHDGSRGSRFTEDV